jgi:hypothetical protein
MKIRFRRARYRPVILVTTRSNGALCYKAGAEIDGEVKAMRLDDLDADFTFDDFGYAKKQAERFANVLNEEIRIGKKFEQEKWVRV